MRRVRSKSLLVAAIVVVAGLPFGRAAADVCIPTCHPGGGGGGGGGGNPPPVFSIDDVTHNEGSATKPKTKGYQRTKFIFTVSRTNPFDAATIDFQTADGTATTANQDYDAKSGTLSFPADVSSMTITVKVVADFFFECQQGEKPPCKEKFKVKLSNPSIGTIGDDKGIGTIVNDDKGGGGG